MRYDDVLEPVLVAAAGDPAVHAPCDHLVAVQDPGQAGEGPGPARVGVGGMWGGVTVLVTYVTCLVVAALAIALAAGIGYAKSK